MYIVDFTRDAYGHFISFCPPTLTLQRRLDSLCHAIVMVLNVDVEIPGLEVKCT